MSLSLEPGTCSCGCSSTSWYGDICRSDDRKKKKAAEQAGAGEDKGHEDGGKGDEGDGGDGKAYEGEGKVN